eukprot:TRINITY_DN102070_c0_g1_i1.p1 TRINITY_DN102070_c0_g1~~TRINITY_DN102070_c0_g1_i1.p1  ORF type:complete len:774 (+),score=55.77 TRINITY_DN102070_c0_g1_i1:41-2362(+)
MAMMIRQNRWSRRARTDDAAASEPANAEATGSQNVTLPGGDHIDPKTGEILAGPGTVVDVIEWGLAGTNQLDGAEGRHFDPWSLQYKSALRETKVPATTAVAAAAEPSAESVSGSPMASRHSFGRLKVQVRQGQGIEEALSQIGAQAGSRQEMAAQQQLDPERGAAQAQHGWPMDGLQSKAQRRNQRRARQRADQRVDEGVALEEREVLGCVVLVRHDCRLHDNPALHHALAEHDWVVPVYVCDTDDSAPFPVRGAGLLWMHESLLVFGQSLSRHGSRLVIRRGAYIDEVLAMVLETGAKSVYFNRQLEPWYHERDKLLQSTLCELGFKARGFSGMVLQREPWEQSSEMTDSQAVPKPLPTVTAMKSPDAWPSSLPLSALGYGTTVGRGFPPQGSFRQYNHVRKKQKAEDDWAHEMRQFWGFGEKGALARLDEFFVEVAAGNYQPPSRYRADRKWTALLSPYLRFGDLSPRLVYWRAMETLPGNLRKPVVRRLFWRDGAYAQLYRWPDSASVSIRQQYEEQTWSGTRLQLKRWQTGTTGFPLVDAAMRQLWKIGWMPNYLRHVTAQFLIEYLDLSWKDGLRWYDYTLVDSDVAINAMMWQMGGHSGMGAWNFVMHPVYAAKKVDPEGHYVRRWLPELAQLPIEYIHCPWEAPVAYLLSANVLVAGSYCQRVIEDLTQARKDHAKGVIAVRKTFPELVLPDGHEVLTLETGEQVRVRVRDDLKDNSLKITLEMTPDDPHSISRRRLTHTKGLHAVLLYEEVQKFEQALDVEDTL